MNTRRSTVAPGLNGAAIALPMIQDAKYMAQFWGPANRPKCFKVEWLIHTLPR
jgi:hypothetical protein